MDLLAELENLAIMTEHENDEESLRTGPSQYQPAPAPLDLSARDQKSTFLVKLEGPLNSPTHIQSLSNSLTTPILKSAEGIDATAPATFCLITGRMKLALLSALAGSTFSPTFIRVNLAVKDLSEYSRAPTLGCDVDPTLPQHRASHAEVFYPMQDQYPVWYFFYGTLAVSDNLAARLGLSEIPMLRKAWVRGGVLRTWGGGKYKALIDGSANTRVDGWAYEVASADEEEMLRYYETDYYEVVRCDIHVQDVAGIVKGLVFRFVRGCG
ncbi:gamma-glutamylcyclotransferase family protein [Aspergillus ibericus CBS 121593]|uniref:Putative gamma-glutamylcyclotransferase n=1 Tax=Aspergillus ibericus CBS 121593 TaxID=1448316 RepID=A0A395GQ04_9EURO|nr:hypothetical protein BO80DRAFT_428280 [Aspergillus ibericus CBS 121593]RAK97436.1 hypothetical protein BO80DRAFT_428280 [Aspergillus ibericus CBS 121593]